MEDMSPLAQDAVGLHVMFLALKEAGFTQIQALRLIAYSITANQDKEEPK